MEPTNLLTPDRKLTTDQSTETTSVQFGKPKCFNRVAYRNMGDGLLTEAEMSQRQPHHHGLPQSG